MKSFLLKLFSSYRTTCVLMLVYAICLAAATWIEKQGGTPAAKAWVYHAPWFFVWQFLMVVNFAVIAWRKHWVRQQKWGALVLHAAFVVILAGAFCSHLFSEEGILHLREGEKSNQIAIRLDGDKVAFHTLPFEVELEDFILKRYPGSMSPSSFESKIKVYVDGRTEEALIFMNNVLDVKGYRFYQASYDPDELGSVLSVNRDVAGRNITYTGYFLLLVGFILCLVDKHSRFMYLKRRLKQIHAAEKVAMLVLFSFLFSMPAKADEMPADIQAIVQKYAVDEAHAAKWGALPVQLENGRMVPMNTFSSEVLRKIHKEDRLGDLNSDQFLLSLFAMPDMWMRVPLISYSDKEIAQQFGLPEKACAYLQVFDEAGNYKFQAQVEEAYGKAPNERTRFDKDLMKLDEQVNILHLLFNYQWVRIFPDEHDANHRWYAPGDDLSSFSGKDSMFVSHIFIWYIGEVQTALQNGDWSKADEVLGMISTYQQAKAKGVDISPKKMQAEIRYNEMNVFGQCKVGYLILGGLLLVFSFAGMFYRIPAGKYISWILMAGVLGVFLFHSYGLGMRWYIGGYAPWSNSYETMVYVAWATVLAGFLFVKGSRITLALAALFGGVILFVSGLSWMDPQISPLVPVLKSPWLMFHVAVIVAAYGFFGICGLLGITNLAIMSFITPKNRAMLTARMEELTVINEMALLLGLALMSIGTFLGAIWANESWGRYWGWDPKETWALITMIVYALVVHLRLVRKWYSLWSFNFLSVMAFSSVLMTFFGVNYFLSGMHSYGENDQIHAIFAYLIGSIVVVVALGIMARWKYRHKTEELEI